MAPQPDSRIAGYVRRSASELYGELGSSADGLTTAEAQVRRGNAPPLARHGDVLRTRTLWNQLRSPLLVLLLFAAVTSAISAAWIDAGVICFIVAATVIIGYRREYTAQTALAALQRQVRSYAIAIRDGKSQRVLSDEIVAGDVVVLSAGNRVPGDAIVLEATELHVNEAALSGESFAIAKSADTNSATTLRARCVWLGTTVSAGTARCLVVATGGDTRLGALAHRLEVRPPEAEFDRGIRRFGYLLTGAMVIIVALVFVAHALAGRPLTQSLLFATALAVGLSPELLPAILSVSLSHGAALMARNGVLVRRLNAIENLGSMDVLCTDKTGTLTMGVVALEGAYDTHGQVSDEVLATVALSTRLQSDVATPLDDAISKARATLRPGQKLAEIPFDASRKRSSVVIEHDGIIEIITKGAFQRVLDIATMLPGGAPLTAASRNELQRLHDSWSSCGTRVIAVAERTLPKKASYGRDHESAMTFLGFITFSDRPKDDAAEAIAALANKGVMLKLVTGDGLLVSQHLAGLVGLRAQHVLRGPELAGLDNHQLDAIVENTDLFVEVDPQQKERVVLSLKRAGHTVGFLGDGVNDAPAMHAADTSLCVKHAVDVAREAADFILLEHSLDVIRRGIEVGRTTFANTMKYVLITTSANVGNMLSMALASLFLPFLPLLPGQILLNNLLSDIPAVGIATDRVDPELVATPHRWDLTFVAHFMIVFGLISSVFDIITFAVLRGPFHAGPELFRTGWFIESLLSELVIALIVRTRRPFFRSKPGTLLIRSTLVLGALCLAIPFLPYAELLGLVSVPSKLIAAILVIAGGYVLTAEIAKRLFYARPL